VSNSVLIKVTLSVSCQRHCRSTMQLLSKRQKRRQSVVAGRQQLYCAVQSRSPDHRRTTTEKVQSSVRDGTSSATVHSDRRRQAVPHTCGSHDGRPQSPSVDGTTSMAVSAECRRRPMSTSGVRH